jgi:hypothetical protein
MNQREDLITGTEGMADPGSETGSKAANALTAAALAAEGMVTRRGAKERDREDADQRASAAASVQDARDALDSREPPAESGDDPATGPKAVAELEADRPATGYSDWQGSAEHSPTTPDAPPEVRPAKVSVRDWLRAAHGPQTEETKTVMARAEQELRASEPELMRQFDQVHAQGQPARDAMTSALGSTRSASNHSGKQEPSSHPSVVMDQHRPARTTTTGCAATATKSRKKTKRANAAMSGSRR